MRRYAAQPHRSLSVRLHALRQRHQQFDAGFTLVEMLAAIVVLVLVSSVVAVGISTGLKVYEQSKFVSESDLLASTINEALADPCRFYNPDTDSIKYNGNTIYNPSLKLSNGQIKVVGYSDTSLTKTLSISLLNSGAYTNCKVIITDKNGNETGTDTLDAFGGGKGYYKIASTTNSNLNRDTVYKFSFKPISPVTKAT